MTTILTCILTITLLANGIAMTADEPVYSDSPNVAVEDAWDDSLLTNPPGGFACPQGPIFVCLTSTSPRVAAPDGLHPSGFT